MINPGEDITADFLNSLPPQAGVCALQTVNSTTQAPVNNCSFPVVSGGTYLVIANLWLDANSGGSAEFKWTGPSASLVLMQWDFTLINTGSSTTGSTDASATTGYNTGFLVSNTFGTNRYRATGWATFTFSAAGTLALVVANGAGASDTFNIIPGSRVTVLQQQV